MSTKAKTIIVSMIVACAIAITLLVLIVVQAERLAQYGLINHLWYPTVTMLGCAAAVLFFGVLKSSAQFSGGMLGGTLTLGGPPVILALVVWAGFHFAPRADVQFDQTIFIHGEFGPQQIPLRSQGNLMLELANDRRQEAIDGKGIVRFVGIPADQRGKKVRVALIADGFELVDVNALVVLGMPSVSVAVRPKSVVLSGQVVDSEGKPIAGARLSLPRTAADTDRDGRFSLSFPSNTAEADLRGTIVAPGYEAWSGVLVLGANPPKISLQQSVR